MAKATDEPTTASRLRLSPVARRLVRSYGILIAIAIAFLLMAMLVREKPKTVPVESMRDLQVEVTQWR